MNFSYVTKAGRPSRHPDAFSFESRLREAYAGLKAALPGVTLYYAVKSNAGERYRCHPEKGGVLLRCLYERGDRYRQKRASVPTQCIHTHPIKRDGDIAYALDSALRRFVVDNEYEL